MAGQTCPCCHQVIAPGDNVAYQSGMLEHLGCYLARRDTRPREDEEGPAPTA
jgi:hypothetical protein